MTENNVPIERMPWHLVKKELAAIVVNMRRFGVWLDRAKIVRIGRMLRMRPIVEAGRIENLHGRGIKGRLALNEKRDLARRARADAGDLLPETGGQGKIRENDRRNFRTKPGPRRPGTFSIPAPRRDR